MLTLKKSLSSLLVLAIAIAPAMAENNEAKPASSHESTNSTEASPSSSPSSSPAPAAAPASPSLASPAADANVTALLGVLVMKGVLAPNEANSIRNAAPTAQFQALVDALSRKGLVSAADLAAATNAPKPAAAAPEASSDSTDAPQMAAQSPKGQPAAGPQTAPAPKAAAMVAAVAPIRTLPVDAPKRDGLIPAFKMGPVKMTPYGFIKATAAHDSSSPNGDDFPFVGLFLTSTSAINTGPTQDPEFHIKARSTRIGANFEWPDVSPRLTFTGKIEGDYEGNFSEVDNRDVSSIRSNSFQLRQAWVRMDYAASEDTDLYFEGGQDWTIFGSSVLPNILETTFLGAYYGTIYERSPQFQVGVVKKLTKNVKLSPTFAIMMPSTGDIEKLAGTLAGFEGQIGQGEREGADSGRPEVEARVALQFPLDKAPGVAPAQILWSGYQGRRTSIVTSDGIAGGTGPAAYAAAFPQGFTTSSTLYGNQIGLSLPTRWATLVASGYFGGDMRFFFGGQVNSFYTQTAGLFSPATYTAVSGALGAEGAPTLACTQPLTGTGNCPGTVVVAPQRPIRAFGGFVNLGLPLSRWFNADPKGHNAGWQLYLHMGKDQVVSGDLHNPSGGALPLLMGKVFAATLYYKVNPYCTFGIEQSVYGTRLEPGVDYTIAGSPDNLWQDHRTEFGPVFTF